MTLDMAGSVCEKVEMALANPAAVYSGSLIPRHWGAPRDMRLLILGCSRRKKMDVGLLPALERYDGPAFRVVRKAQRQGVQLPATLVLSAEYGLISAQHLIATYDRPMSQQRAEELVTEVAPLLRKCLSRRDVGEDVFVCMGEDYLGVLLPMFREAALPIIIARGSIGRRSSLLKQWVCPHEPVVALPKRETTNVTLRGLRLKYNADEVVRFALTQAGKDPAGASRYASWYVSAGELRVAPKWLLGQLTGVPVAKLRTADALRVLTSLGIEVLRV